MEGGMFEWIDDQIDERRVSMSQKGSHGLNATIHCHSRQNFEFQLEGNPYTLERAKGKKGRIKGQCKRQPGQ